MWMVAGILLGVVVLASLAGFHSGPHAHALAGAAGLVVAAWFVFMAVDGRSGPLLWILLGADLVVTFGVGITAWRVLTTRSDHGRHFNSLESAEGVAVSDLAPEGIVRVRGEEWSAVSVNGRVPSGSRVQVLRDGVRLEIWGEDAEAMPTDRAFSLGRAGRREGSA
jgi:membrane-bound ClpP family serine protease